MAAMTEALAYSAAVLITIVKLYFMGAWMLYSNIASTKWYSVL
jgi:hypothetical protein